MLGDEEGDGETGNQTKTEQSGLDEFFSFSEPTEDQSQTSQTANKSEPAQDAILDSLPTFEDVTPEKVDEDNKNLGDAPQSGIDSIPIVKDVLGSGDEAEDTSPKGVQDLPLVGDIIETVEQQDQPTEKGAQKGINDLPVVGDFLDTVNTQFTDEASPPKDEKSTQTEVSSSERDEESAQTETVSPETGEVSTPTEEPSTKTVETWEALPEKSIKSVTEIQEASPVSAMSPVPEELVLDSLPKDEKSTVDWETEHSVRTSIDHDEDSAATVDQSVLSAEEKSATFEGEVAELSVKSDEKTPKQSEKEIDFDHLSDLTREDTSVALSPSAHTEKKSSAVSSLSSLSLSELHSQPIVVQEQYEAGTEVVAHMPDHHSMKTDQVAENLVNKHLEDSSASSSDNDSGVSKMELTNVDHNSDEHHYSSQHGTSNADSNMFGATSDSHVGAYTLGTKTVNTQVSKIKFQHGRKWAALSSATAVLATLMLIVSY